MYVNLTSRRYYMFTTIAKCVTDSRLDCVARGTELVEKTVDVLARTLNRLTQMMLVLRDDEDADKTVDDEIYGVADVVEAFVNRDTERGVWDDESFLAVCTIYPAPNC